MTIFDIFHEFESQEAETDVTKAKWYIIMAVALAAAHKGQHIPELYHHATKHTSKEQRMLIQRRIKEALVKGAVLYGIPRAGQALGPLFDVLPADEVDRFAPRTDAETSGGIGTLREIRSARAKKFFDTLWTPDAAQGVRDRIVNFCPDHYLLNVRSIYELWISEDAIISNIETEMCFAALLTCLECPTQAFWHTRGIVRHGGSRDQARFAQALGLAVAAEFGCNVDGIKMVNEMEF